MILETGRPTLLVAAFVAPFNEDTGHTARWATSRRLSSRLNAASALAALSQEEIQLRLQPRTLNLRVANQGGSAYP